MEKRFKIDGYEVALSELLAVNDFNAEEIAALQTLGPRDFIVYGGGAAAEQVLQRIA